MSNHSSTAADVIILGAGIAGASLAYELAQTHKVILLEREERPGLHSTGRSAAIFSEIYGNATVRALTRASRKNYFSPPPGFSDIPLVSPRSTLFIAPHDQVEALDAMRRESDVHRGTEILSPERALKLVPILRQEQVASALLEPGATDIDVNAVHQGFLKGFKARGGSLICDVHPRRIIHSAGLWQLDTQTDRFSSPVLVNAAGAWADEVAATAGVAPLGIQPKRRTVVLLDGPQEHDIRSWPLTIDAKETFYFKPDAGRILLTPADETPSPPCDAQPEEIDIAHAIDRFETMTTMKVRRVVHKWAGLRSFARDKTPVSGFDPAAKGFYWQVGQGGYGMQTCWAMASFAAAMIRGEDLPNELKAQDISPSSLSPARLR